MALSRLWGDLDRPRAPECDDLTRDHADDIHLFSEMLREWEGYDNYHRELGCYLS
jgi:hypothetical protein